ncbi:MAG: response regulator [Bdellovibrionota bacterium]
MIRFNGNSILVVEGDKAYAFQLKQILEERGAMVTTTSSIDESRKHLNRVDFDMIICSQSLSDGSARDLMDWCKDSLSNIPIFAALGNCTQFEKKQLEKLGVENFFSKNDSVKLFDDISRALFSFDDFKKNFLESRFEKGISYELKIGGKKIMVKALEIMEKGVFLSFETPFSLGHSATLSLNCSEGLNIDSVTLRGALQGEFAGGQYFQVQDEDLKLWEKILSQLCKKQDDVTQFLKKASGK